MRIRKDSVLHRLRDGKKINAIEFYSEGMISLSQVCNRWSRYNKSTIVYLACFFLEMYSVEASFKDPQGRIFHVGQDKTDNSFPITYENVETSINTFLDTDYEDFEDYDMKKVMVKVSDIEKIEEVFPDLLCSPVEFYEIEQHQEDAELLKIQNENKALKAKVKELEKLNTANLELKTKKATDGATKKRAEEWKKCLEESISLFCLVCERGNENFTSGQFDDFAKQNGFGWTQTQYDVFRKAIPHFLVKKTPGTVPQ